MRKSVALVIGATMALSIVLVGFTGIKNRVESTVNMESFTPDYATVQPSGAQYDLVAAKDPASQGYDYSFSDDGGISAKPILYASGLSFTFYVTILPENTTDKSYRAFLDAGYDATKISLAGDSSKGYTLSILKKPTKSLTETTIHFYVSEKLGFDVSVYTWTGS